MKRVAITGAILAVASFTFAQAGATQSQNPPAGQQNTAAKPNAPAQETPRKHPPQAKTQPEFDALKAASANTDPAAVEKAADDFAAKFPDRELRVILDNSAMPGCQNGTNSDQ